MKRFLWLSAFILAVSTGCSEDSLVGPERRSASWTMTFVEPSDPSTTCQTPCACGLTTCTCGSTSCANNCDSDSESCCPASHCDKDGRHK